MAMHKVEISGLNTSDIEVISSEEMERLFLALKENPNDSVIRDRLVHGNMKLVLSILKKFGYKNENMDDLFQVGIIGLLKAIDNFDLSYGTKFSTYCVPMVLGEVKRYLRDNNSSIRVSRSVKDNAYKALKLKEELTMKNGVEPSNEELANILGVDVFDLNLAFDSLIPPISLFEPIYNDGGDTIYLVDQVEDKTCRDDLELRMSIDNAIRNLSLREQQILEDRYMYGKTQMEIAEEIGISQAQISRLEKSAISRIRKQM